MISKQVVRRTVLVLVLAVTPFLAGAQCAFFFSSGSGDPDRDDEEDERAIVVSSGSFGATPVAGADYVSGSVSGVTGPNGEFQYEVGKPVRFSIGDIALGRAVSGKPVVTPADLAGAAAGGDNAAAINIERLLQSLDADPGDDAITIPARVREKAVRSNEMLSSAIEFLDYSDEAAFTNAASQLVTVLTRDYQSTGVLVDAETARRALNNR